MRNSAIAYKPCDAFVQHASVWLTLKHVHHPAYHADFCRSRSNSVGISRQGKPLQKMGALGPAIFEAGRGLPPKTSPSFIFVLFPRYSELVAKIANLSQLTRI